MSSDNQIIKNAIKNNKLSHAYLFYGQRGVDLESPILDSIKTIFQDYFNDLKNNKITRISDLNYYDLKVIEPNEDDLIIKEQINKVITELSESALSDKKIKILYIKDVDKGNKHSLNRLLKFLEEPTPNLIVFMSTNKFDKVISTIRSRTQNIYIKPENLNQKIEKMKLICGPEFASILAMIYPNEDAAKKIDCTLFSQTYEEMLGALKKGLENPYSLKVNLSLIWTKDNNDFLVNLLELFYYYVLKTADDSLVLFTNHQRVILEHKKKLINYFQIHQSIIKLKEDQRKFTNFNLQKNSFLIELENEYKKIIQ